MTKSFALSHLEEREAETIHILREVAAQAERPVMLYSIGKDSSAMLHMARKAFFPAPVPFPLLHVDTGFKFEEMYTFRDEYTRTIGAKLIVHKHEEAKANGANPFDLGTQRCCALLKTEGLLQALRLGEYDAAIGGARRDEERSRAKERVFSFRDTFGQWDPKNQRPELWSLYNGKVRVGESIRVFPLSNWTELEVWQYIEREEIPVVPLYFSKLRKVVVRGSQLIPVEADPRLLPGEKIEQVICRFRSLGCTFCTGAVRSRADSIKMIIDELIETHNSERANRVIDHDCDGSMERKKQEGYF